MEKLIKHNPFNMINDISTCLEDAQDLADHFARVEENDRVRKVFNSLAGDKTIGFLAYVIWKGRNRWISSLSNS